MRRVLVILFIAMASQCAGQSQEVKQLLLNWEKLTQFKGILKNMYDGWKLVNKGYTTIKDISAGNFKIHRQFLDGLLEISPAVKSYKRISDIIRYQVLMVKQYKRALREFRGNGVFSEGELDYITKVYTNLIGESLKNLDELIMVITAGKLRMSDEERLKAIDRIYEQIEDQFAFLQDFSSSTAYLALQRKTEKTEVDMSRRIQGFPPK
ncbi:MAG: TerB family tellurite resistance protein [Sphingobacteriales bacterium]|nr:TerB family tellurite resistance protein [Sphingobacteriales bacterium]